MNKYIYIYVCVCVCVYNRTYTGLPNETAYLSTVGTVLNKMFKPLRLNTQQKLFVEQLLYSA